MDIDNIRNSNPDSRELNENAPLDSVISEPDTTLTGKNGRGIRGT